MKLRIEVTVEPLQLQEVIDFLVQVRDMIVQQERVDRNNEGYVPVAPGKK